MSATDIDSRMGACAYSVARCKAVLRLIDPFRTATPGREPAQTIEGELLAHYADQPLIQPVGVVLTIGTIAALACYHTHSFWPLAWVALIVAYHLYYGYKLPHLITQDARKQKRNLRMYCFLAALSGAIYALSICLFPFIPQVEQFVAAVIIAALCTGAVTAFAGYGPALNSHAGIALGGVIIGLLFLPGETASEVMPNWLNEVFAFLILVYLIVIVGHGRQVFRVFKESFDIRLRQVALNEELRAALDKAELASRAKTRFLASASHDLRQPIHTLSLFSAVLSMRELDSECRDIVDSMDTALTTLAAQFDTLLDISRLDAGVIAPESRVCDLQSILKGLHCEYVPVCENKALHAQLDASVAAFAQTDPALLTRILRNLLSNAVRYTESGTIKIALRQTSAIHIISISDTGKGIPAAQQKHVFEEFYQLDNPERDRTKGFGLGLPIVRRLCDMLSINVDMNSTEGSGTTFELRLPALENVPASDDENIIADASAAADTSVLVIDDEAGIRQGMKIFLEDLGYKVSLADSSKAAVELASREPPDVVLADLRLRGDDSGIKSIQSIRALNPDTQAVLISGDTAPNRLREANDAGIEFLHKPVSPQRLREVLTKFGSAK